MSKKYIMISLQLIIIALVLGMFLFYVDLYGVEKLLQLSSANLPLTLLLILLIYSLKSVIIFFPVVAIQVAVANIFPPHYAILINLIGNFIAFSIPYFIAKKYLKNPFDYVNKTNKNVKKILLFRTNNEIEFVMFARLTGLSMELISVLMGSLKINYFKYIIGSMIGTVGYTVSFTLLGSAISNPFSIEFFNSILLSLAIFAITMLFIKIYNNVSKKTKKIKNDY